MAIENNMVNIPLANSPSESKINTPEKDLLPEIKLPELGFGLNSLFQAETKEEKNKEKNYISKHILPITTIAGVITNLLSAPIRLFDDDNPLKKLINNFSMLMTRTHQLSVSGSGLLMAAEQKNPFLIFSYLTEGLAALPLLNIRNIYLFRGIATGVDGAVAGVKDRLKRMNPNQDFSFKSFQEGFKFTWEKMVEITKEFIQNPAILKKLDGEHTLVSSSIMMVLGSIFGLTVNDKVGGSIRDFFGGINDFGLTQVKESTGRKAGGFYLMGTAKDFLARFFNENTAAMLGINEVAKFMRFRDLFHELALAFDRVGQFFFQRHLEDSGEDEQEKINTKKVAKTNLHKSLLAA